MLAENSDAARYGKGDPMSVGPRLRMFIPSLTACGKSVVEWLLDRQNFKQNVSISEVSTALGVSEALVVKVSRRLGYSGFRELRSDLAEYHRLLAVKIREELSRDDSPDAVGRKIFQATRQVLEEVQSITPPEALEEAARIIYKARQRDIYGVGGSATVCADAAHKFLRIGIRASVFSDSHLMRMSANLLGKGDVALTISHSGQTSDLVTAAVIARKAGAQIIVLTNSFASRLAQEGDIVLCAPAHASPLMGQNAAARIAQLTLIDVLFMCLARQNYELAEANLRKTMSAVGLYHDPLACFTLSPGRSTHRAKGRIKRLEPSDLPHEA